MPIEFTLYVTSSWRAREASGGGAVGGGMFASCSAPVEHRDAELGSERLSLLNSTLEGLECTRHVGGGDKELS